MRGLVTGPRAGYSPGIRVRFALLDNVRCGCGNEELHLEGAITMASSENQNGICRRFCGWKQLPVATSGVTPAECAECRRQTIVEGNLRCACGLSWPIVKGVPSFSSKRILETPSGIRIGETNPRTDPRWEPFVRAHPDGLPFHHPGWVRSLEEEYGQRRLHLAAEDREGRLLGILPMFYTRGLPFNIGGNATTARLCSLPRTPAAGVLSVDGEATASLLQAAVDCSRQRGGTQLQIKTGMPDLEKMASGLAATSWRPTYVAALPENSDEITFGNSAARHRLKWAVNKAMKVGVEVREAESETELRAWYPLYLEVMREHVVPARPYRFFRGIWELLGRDGVLRLLLAERQIGRCRVLLAGSIILTLGKTACYAFTGGKRKDFALHPNDLIQWRAIHDACRMGARRYDFGEVAEEHPRLVNFKSKWGAEPSAQFRYYWPAPAVAMDCGGNSYGRLRQAASSAWRRMPLAATGRIGDWIYSYL